MNVRRIMFSQHAFIRMFERGISPAAVKRGVRTGESIESYPDDQPFPSVLLLHFEAGRALHIVAGVDETEAACYIVTVYWPEPGLWSADFRTRRSE